MNQRQRNIQGPGEIVYAEGSRVLTRYWNYGDAELSKVTTLSRHVIFILERASAAATASNHLEATQKELADLVAGRADEIALTLVDAANPEVTIR